MAGMRVQGQPGLALSHCRWWGAEDWPHRRPSVASQNACHPVTMASWAVLMSYHVKHGFCSVLSHSTKLGALFDSVSSHRLGLGSLS